MRRPNPIAWTPQLDEYLNNLKESMLSPTDDLFCKLLTIEHVCHVADKELYLSDPSKHVLQEPKTLSTIQGLQARTDGLSFGGHTPLEKCMCIKHSGLRKRGVFLTDYTSSYRIWQARQCTIYPRGSFARQSQH